ncbi:MAG: ABC transporter permease [Rhizobiales bacterium]|nr:ABC transporter permease [Hyphomicrobiales bacterium]MBI3672110.1 ABC transporter permease [Hyphomicrobiales bacterium]
MTQNRLGPIVPAGAGSLRSLTVTMAVMCYLACLAIGALVLIDRAVESWTSGLSREATVQVRQLRGADVEQELAKAEALLRGFPGIAGADVLDREAGAKLLEPWLGSQNLDDLPIPRLIRVTIDETSPPDYAALEKALASKVKGTTLDTHRRWQTELTRMARALSLLSYAVLLLIGISAIAMVIFATRTVLEANRPVVDVLHLVGATDGYISRQIDRRFLKTGLWAGLIGVCLGLFTFLLLGFTGAEGAGGIADASRSLLFAPPAIAARSYALLFAVPVVAILISLITSRLTLIRMLRNVQ